MQEGKSVVKYTTCQICNKPNADQHQYIAQRDAYLYFSAVWGRVEKAKRYNGSREFAGYYDNLPDFVRFVKDETYQLCDNCFFEYMRGMRGVDYSVVTGVEFCKRRDFIISILHHTGCEFCA